MSRHSLVCVGSACGAIFTISTPLHAGLYSYDDGSSEIALGVSTGGETAAIHAFSTIAAQNTIGTISMTFGTPASPGQSGLVGGETLKVYVWSDTDGDGDPSNGGFLRLRTTITTVSAGSIDTDIFQNVVITPVVVPATGFFIGYAVTHAAGTFPLSRDQSQPSLGRAWWGADTTGNWNPNLMAGDVLPVPVDADVFGVLAVWLLRASVEPPGVCCISNPMSCIFVTQADCAQQGGIYGGDDTECVLNPFGACTCGPGAGDCLVAHAAAGCQLLRCCEPVCLSDPACCSLEWDADCAGLATLFQPCNPNCPWDCQPPPISGSVDVPDLLALLAAWNLPYSSDCDFNGDHVANVPDLLALLAAWGACP